MPVDAQINYIIERMVIASKHTVTMNKYVYTLFSIYWNVMVEGEASW